MACDIARVVDGEAITIRAKRAKVAHSSVTEKKSMSATIGPAGITDDLPAIIQCARHRLRPTQRVDHGQCSARIQKAPFMPFGGLGEAGDRTRTVEGAHAHGAPQLTGYPRHAVLRESRSCD